MIRASFAALVSHWWRNPLQLFTLLSGLALATALWSGVQAVNAEARASYDAAAAQLDEGAYDQLLRRDGKPLSTSDYVALRRAGWIVSPVIEGRVQDVRILGIDPLTAPVGLGPVSDMDGTAIAAFISGEKQIFATAQTLRAMGDLHGIEKVQSDTLAPNVAYTDIATAQGLLGRAAEIDLVVITQDQPLLQPDLATVAPDLQRRVAQAGGDMAKLTDSFHLNLTAFGLLSFAVGIFIVNGAIGLAFEQRRPVVRTLRALGMSLQGLMWLLAAELLIFALVAGALGVGLGYLIAGLLLPDVAATLKGLYGAEISGSLQLRPAWWLTGLGIAVGGTALAGANALWQLSQMPLLSAAQPRALALAAGRRSKRQAVAGVALLAGSVGLGLIASSLMAGFAMLAALLIGAAIVLPAVLARALIMGEKHAKSVVSQWFWADTRQQLPGLSLALMALLLAMAANVGVSTMVSSFRLTFLGFLDQRLAAELYVHADTQQDADLIANFAATRADAVLPIQSQQVEIAGVPTDVFGARDHATYRDHWTFLTAADDPWGDVLGGAAILINEQLARRAKLTVGQTIHVVGQSFKVAGVYGDYGNPIGQALMNEAPFADLFPNVTPARFGLRMDPDQVANFRQDLRAATGIPEANVINQAGIKAFSLDIFDRTFTVTTALNVLTLAVAAFAILMSLLTLATMRVPQLAPAWAVGVTRRTLGRLEILRAVMLAVMTTVLAVPLGLALAWALLAVVNVAAFGWRLPMYIFPFDYARLAGFAVLAAALAALWPARRLAQTPPAALLKVFSNER